MVTIQELEFKINSLPTKEILMMVGNPSEWTEDAISIGRSVLSKRGILLESIEPDNISRKFKKRELVIELNRYTIVWFIVILICIFESSSLLSKSSKIDPIVCSALFIYISYIWFGRKIALLKYDGSSLVLCKLGSNWVRLSLFELNFFKDISIPIEDAEVEVQGKYFNICDGDKRYFIASVDKATKAREWLKEIGVSNIAE